MCTIFKFIIIVFILNLIFESWAIEYKEERKAGCLEALDGGIAKASGCPGRGNPADPPWKRADLI